MNKLTATLLLGAALVAVADASPAKAGGPRVRADRHAMYQASRQPWHGEYYHTSTGYPIPLVVPPTARSQAEWSWGVAQSEIRPIHHQYLRPYMGDAYGDSATGFLPTPPWPSHTRQFGVYSVRGPW